MGIYSIKPKFQQLLSPVTSYLIRQRVHPTALNIAGLLFSLVTAACLYYSTQTPWLLVIVPIAVFIRTALNALDGQVSRSLGIASPFGEVLNEFLDRVSDAAIFFAIALLPTVDLILGSVTVIAILLNSYLSIASKAAGASRQYGGIMGKADRMIYLGLAALVVFVTSAGEFWNYFLWIILLGTLITLLTRFNKTKKELE
ncbi:MAG: hypothetical protein COU11_02685 [Candidatus Harrisonbacteria bacterium CG10_big_fil_rev_8_21_14_0_10_49_15]|uniref:CDP-alcohol phosphatidyltransferase family protein n=1 Tax=Candidatus Harrisonbacteria bacterium CG10_big_fil_rev_8_21_14_0_10_49_15 TaxID=1974587 RepID=A0A2H0UL26_9BACT|nr:MAG: hypothetical protein COU11_02685 [Candidatus Harrisonbacteria bacterium CG10_big_fil_rev_8_21_14_0_10_49_15]